ncbi:UNVERIFIED_CONTAM: hypothetical protein GTU68_066426 [Idotea baltica]|nr:hypothetical protein [Idotea baltica]
MQAVQSALAVRRQRSRREEVRKAKQRRESSASVLSTPRHSVVSIDGSVYFDDTKESKRVLSYVTMFHVGGVLILIGLMLVITSLMPSYVKSTSAERRNDLLGTGSFFVILGGLLTTISRFISNHEEKELNDYIQGQLARSKSGHRLVRHAEGGDTPSRERRHHGKASENGVGPPHSSGAGARPGRGAGGEGGSSSRGEEGGSDCLTPTSSNGDVATGVDSPLPLSSSADPVLSRILEEDEIECDTDATTEPLDSTPQSSLTPTSPLETQGLLDRRHSPRSGSKGSVKSSSKSFKLT